MKSISQRGIVQPLFKLKNPKFQLFAVLFILITSYHSKAQDKIALGNAHLFVKNLFSNTESESFQLKVSEQKSHEIFVTKKIGDERAYKIIGTTAEKDAGTLTLYENNGKTEGNLVFPDKELAYKLRTNEGGDLVISQADIHDVLCIGTYVDNPEEANNEKVVRSKAQPIFNSLPGARAVVYLDFDGEVVSGTSWVGGGTINAQPRNWSDAKIQDIWEMMADDFRPWTINVTTERAVYDAAPSNSRMMCIFTGTNDASPGAGGVAYVGSFDNNSGNPCWVFNSGTQSAAVSGSHEVGHTVGLSHDGNSNSGYDSGNGLWGPIMGTPFNEDVMHWSKGEYNDANRFQDDLAIIEGNRNVAYRDDDHGDNLQNATEIVHSNGNVAEEFNHGLIERNTDKDMFSFITSGGQVNFSVSNEDISWTNLNIQARLLDGNGNEILSSNPDGLVPAVINTNLAGGTYFIEVDGAGEATWASGGYGDYACMGNFFISGSYNPGSNNQPPISNFTAIQNCGTVTFSSTSLNTVNSYVWDFGDGTTSTEESPTHIYTSSGIYDVTLTVSNDFGNDSETKIAFIEIIIPTIPGADNVTVCEGSDAELSATGNTYYIWYDEIGGSVIGTEPNLTIPNVTSDETVYVVGTSSPAQETAGIEAPENGGYYANDTRGLYVDVTAPILWKSADINAENAGERTFVIKDSPDGNILESTTIDVPQGNSTVDLNLPLPAGNQLYLGVSGTANLYRDNSGVNYPYVSTNGTVTITSSNSTSPADYYYFFYNNVFGEEACPSAAKEVNIAVVEQPLSPTIIENGSQLSVEDNYDNYQWLLNGVAINGANQSNYTATVDGDYSVIVDNGGLCEASSNTVTVLVSSTQSAYNESSLKIFPNPARGELFIDGLTKATIVKLINSNGIVVFEELTTYDLNLSDINPGLYYVFINNDAIKPIVIQ